MKAGASKTEHNTKRQPRWPGTAALIEDYAAPGQLSAKGSNLDADKGSQLDAD